MTSDGTYWAGAEVVTLERVRYFAGQVLGSDDFAQEQLYLREKGRRHNRMLHGWGIVCGLEVRQLPGPCELKVEAGYALDPWGEEIVIDHEVDVDLCKEDCDGNAVAPCGGAELAPVEWPAGQVLYVAVRYAECPARPVGTVSGGSNEVVEYSRTRESFAVKALSELPATYAIHEQQPVRSCPEPPTEPWVVLAEVVVGPDLGLASVDSAKHRRQAASQLA